MSIIKTVVKMSLIFILTTAIILPMTAANSFSQDIKATLFKEADQAKNSADDSKAELLAPKNYSKAMEYYHDAKDDLKKGENLEDIRKKLAAAESYFNKATKATKLAEITLANPMKARSDALNADAPNYAKELWKHAEEKFADAAEELENGDVNDSKEKGSEAETLYRKAELKAIKGNYLDETRSLIERAEDMDADDEAPVTLAKAKSLIEKTAQELEQNRYDTDYPRSLAKQAKYEAKHAIYLAKTIKDLKDADKEFEDVLLAAEKPLSKIAGTIDVVAEFDNGYDNTTSSIVDYIKTMQDKKVELEQDISDRNQQIENLKSRVAELEEKLGGVKKEKSELALRMEAQAKIKKKYEDVEKTFTKEEARVLRTPENELIIRLLGLNFASGKSVIEPKYFSILTKVQNAIKNFPESKIKVEGHTDSFGGDEMNLKLSQDRADAVKAYLMANMGLDESRIEAVGFGESNPIANNETSEGRTKNRRIDIIIQPNL